MTPQQIVGTASRLFGIWLAITAFQAVAIGSALKAGTSDPNAVWVPYAIGAMYLAAGLACWFFPMFIAHRLVPRTRFEDTLKLPAQQALMVASVVLGLLVVAFKAVAPVLGYLSVCALWIGSGQTLFTIEAGRHVDGLIGFAQLGLGLFLIFRADIVGERLLPGDSIATPAIPHDAQAEAP